MRRLASFLLILLLAGSSAAQDVYNPACNGPWTSYAGTASAQTPGITPPTFSVVSSRYKLCGNKTVLLQAAVSVTAAGTGLGAIRVTLPFTAGSATFAGSSYEYGVTGTGGTAAINSGGTFVGALTAAAATYIVTGQAVALGITYEIP